MIKASYLGGVLLERRLEGREMGLNVDILDLQPNIGMNRTQRREGKHYNLRARVGSSVADYLVIVDRAMYFQDDKLIFDHQVENTGGELLCIKSLEKMNGRSNNGELEQLYQEIYIHYQIDVETYSE